MRTNHRNMLYALLALLLLLLSSCGAGLEERVWLNAPGWERGRLVGTTVPGDPVPVALDDEQQVYLLLLTQAGDAASPQVVKLNRAGEIVWERMVDAALTLPDQPGLVWDGEQLNLFWLDQEQLFWAQMDSEGELSGAPIRLGGERDIGYYDVAASPAGVGELALWFSGSRRSPGVYALPTGDLQGEPLLVDAEAIRPDLQYDTDGVLHAIWAHYLQGATDSQFFYAAMAGGTAPPGMVGTEILDMPISVTSNLSGPLLGLDEELVYIFWTLAVRTGLEAGAVKTEYLAFPHGQPEEAGRPQELAAPIEYTLVYEELAADLEAGPRVSLQGMPIFQAPRDLQPNDVMADELAVAVQIGAAYELRKEANQAGVLFFEEGAARSYQLVSFTRTNSSSPGLVSDENGYLYLSWLEPGVESGFAVYFASTAPDIRDSLAAISGGDIVAMGTETIFGMLAGAVLTPFVGILWLIAPLFVLGITSFVRKDSDRVIGLGTVVSLVLALAAFWLVKYLTLPGFSSYTPFSIWIPIMPEWLGLPLRILVTLFIAASALWVAWRYTYGRRNQSALYFMLYYAAVDALLSMAVYGIIVYGYI